ncbi:hypothetical protein DAPPUDRAFT_98492 [Daphnia pulex]|uniref:Uncharacterized protein n=1 Tax=Daphnia pulex TaxID=6669 RepID=E9G3V7_DAPPU|nr:hypothetical protein DAPPUDRAFT_98492 [Daphnia pulex]|eukprot:EFX85919.1 hypothetical protein DAPPUDRAFT_98492 [Daphnia pulex]
MESLYQVSLVDDDIDGQIINGWHLRQLALVMKILNGANMEGDGQADGLFAKMAVIIRVIEAKVAPPQIITMRHCEQRSRMFSYFWVRSLSRRLLISIHVFIRRQEEEKEKKYKNEKKKRELTVKCEAHTYDLVIPPPFSAAVDDETAKKAE